MTKFQSKECLSKIWSHDNCIHKSEQRFENNRSRKSCRIRYNRCIFIVWTQTCACIPHWPTWFFDHSAVPLLHLQTPQLAAYLFLDCKFIPSCKNYARSGNRMNNGNISFLLWVWTAWNKSQYSYEMLQLQNLTAMFCFLIFLHSGRFYVAS